jgi:tetratricopeptide (TPR) repeat protein
MSATMTDERYLEQLRLCVGLRQQGCYKMALEIAGNLAQARPKESSVWHTLGQVLTDMGEFEKALECHRYAVALMRERGMVSTRAKDFQTAALGLAYALMRAGRFEEAWPFWEAGRLEVSWSPWPGSTYWNGQEQTDSLLVQAEGGYGDLFMLMRWLPLLKTQKGVQRLGLMIWPRMQNLCNWAALGVDQVYRIGVDQIRFGAWRHACSIMSLPMIFDMRSWEDVPAPTQLFSPRWGSSYLSEVKRIGFCWRSEENAVKTKTRSLSCTTASKVCRKLLDPMVIDNVALFSLSVRSGDLYGGGYKEEPDGLQLEEERQTDWYTTACYMCSMDFILTVDTAVAHLAGLLGIPTLVLLPKSSSWQWGMPDRASGPWYGEQLTYYRQPKPLIWDTEEIVKALLERVKS